MMWPHRMAWKVNTKSTESRVLCISRALPLFGNSTNELPCARGLLMNKNALWKWNTHTHTFTPYRVEVRARTSQGSAALSRRTARRVRLRCKVDFRDVAPLLVLGSCDKSAPAGFPAANEPWWRLPIGCVQTRPGGRHTSSSRECEPMRMRSRHLGANHIVELCRLLKTGIRCANIRVPALCVPTITLKERRQEHRTVLLNCSLSHFHSFEWTVPFLSESQCSPASSWLTLRFFFFFESLVTLTAHWLPAWQSQFKLSQCARMLAALSLTQLGQSVNSADHCAHCYEVYI